MLAQDDKEKQEEANAQAKEEVKEKKEGTDIEQLDSGRTANGILEVLPDGYGFIRCENYLPGENDVYVSPSQIRRFNLKTGDIITGNTRIKTQSEKFSALLYVSTINGLRPAEAVKRHNFEDRLDLPESEDFAGNTGSNDCNADRESALSDGKGQRNDRITSESR